MDFKLNCNSIISDSIVDGPGLRFVIFVQGCPHKCPGCHNPQTHAFTPVHLYSIEELYQQYIQNPLLSGVTFSGGEPFCQASPLAELARLIKAAGGNVITYTGYTYEALCEMAAQSPDTAALLEVTDFLVDGPYVEERKAMELPFRGSDNQRIWDLQQKKILDSF